MRRECSFMIAEKLVEKLMKAKRWHSYLDKSKNEALLLIAKDLLERGFIRYEERAGVQGFPPFQMARQYRFIAGEFEGAEDARKKPTNKKRKQR